MNILILGGIGMSHQIMNVLLLIPQTIDSKFPMSNPSPYYFIYVVNKTTSTYKL